MRLPEAEREKRVELLNEGSEVHAREPAPSGHLLHVQLH